LFRHDHLHQIIAARAQRAQLTGLLVGQFADLELSPLGVQRQHAGINAIGLGQLSQTPGERAHPAWIDQHHRQLRCLKTRDQESFITTGRLNHDPCTPDPRQPLDQGA
jgi:hypothetical protein